MKVDIHSKKRVFDSFFKIDEVKLKYEKFDGSMTPLLTRLNFERGDSAAAIVFNADTQKLILVNQFKYPCYEKGPGWITEVVAGMINPGESPEAAIRREVLEEIGYEADRVEPICTFYVSPGGSSERICLFYAEVTNPGLNAKGGGVVSEGEDIRLIEISAIEAQEMLSNDTIQDAKTIMALMWFLNRRSDRA
jgi:nudix-type nucleoside diphosphatase (YffH/AdpP family)